MRGYLSAGNIVKNKLLSFLSSDLNEKNILFVLRKGNLEIISQITKKFNY